MPAFVVVVSAKAAATGSYGAETASEVITVTTAISLADRGDGTFDSPVCELVTWVRDARYYSALCPRAPVH
ncbi:hypothetical protein GCM10011574_43530 [Microbispora bryophytorum]|uniref:Uncharacterized protein n=1 Tax=Microbispora bryophytorum TaxID=1460882 RepID=A0A8H9H0Y7_9ACTN|nr:hypothetical protein GCM10011574_43530 [Microbispora bryophytorum]